MVSSAKHFIDYVANLVSANKWEVESWVRPLLVAEKDSMSFIRAKSWIVYRELVDRFSSSNEIGRDKEVQTLVEVFG